MKWTTFVGFLFGFGLAFGLTAALDAVGPSPIEVWALFVLVGLALTRLPALGTPSLRAAPGALYGSVFMLLWVLSNPRRDYTHLRTLVYEADIAATSMCVAISALWFLSLYQKQPKSRLILSALGPLFLCCWLVAYFSSSTGAASHFISWVSREFGWNQNTAYTVVLGVRKSLHFLFYGTISVLAMRLARLGGLARQAAAFGILFTLFHASFDEIRQAFYPDRGSSFLDVCLDMSGALVFVGVGSTLSRARTKK